MLVTLAITLLLSACGGQSAPTAPSTASPSSKSSASPSASGAASPAAKNLWDDVVEKGKKEGKITVYGTWSDAQAGPLKEAFVKAYPGIGLDFLAMTGTEIMPRVESEQSTGKYAADLYISGSTTSRALAQKGYLEIWEPPALKEPGVQFAFDPTMDKDGPIVHVVDKLFIVVNKDLVPVGQEPKTWKELEDPKWQGRVLLLNPASSGGGNVWFAGAREMYGEDYVRKVIENSAMYKGVTSGLSTDVARGEYPVAVPGWGSAIAPLIKQGAPLRAVMPTDGLFVILNQTALIKNAPHTNAAKVFFNFLFSKEGQSAMAQMWTTPMRTDVPPIFEELKGTTMAPGQPPTKEFENTKFPEARSAAQKIMDQLGK